MEFGPTPPNNRVMLCSSFFFFLLLCLPSIGRRERGGHDDFQKEVVGTFSFSFSVTVGRSFRVITYLEEEFLPLWHHKGTISKHFLTWRQLKVVRKQDSLFSFFFLILRTFIREIIHRFGTWSSVMSLRALLPSLGWWEKTACVFQ